MNFVQFCFDYRVQIASERDKHYRPDWVNIRCPFCVGHDGFHLGFNRQSNFFTCWRCGHKSVSRVLSRLSGLSASQIMKEAEKKYGWKRDPISSLISDRKEKPKKPFFMPTGSKKKLSRHHLKYLERRNFDVDELQDLWKIEGTGPVGAWKHRIVIPIYFQHRLISWTCRWVGSDGPPKYIACPVDVEIYPHKHMLYGWDYVHSDSIVVVEGPTDVWRLGPGAVATFGIEWSLFQLELLSTFDCVFFAYDREPTAEKKARQALEYLSLMGVPVTKMILLDREDPGDLKESEADQIMAEVLM